MQQQEPNFFSRQHSTNAAGTAAQHCCGAIACRARLRQSRARTPLLGLHNEHEHAPTAPTQQHPAHRANEHPRAGPCAPTTAPGPPGRRPPRAGPSAPTTATGPPGPRQHLANHTNTEHTPCTKRAPHAALPVEPTGAARQLLPPQLYCTPSALLSMCERMLAAAPAPSSAASSMAQGSYWLRRAS